MAALTQNTYLAIVNANDAADHFWHNDHVTQMCLYNSRFFVRRCLLLSFAKLLDQAHGAAFETALEATASTSVDELRAMFIC